MAMGKRANKISMFISHKYNNFPIIIPKRNVTRVNQLFKWMSHVCLLLPCQEAQGEASRKRKAEREQSFVPPPEVVQGKGKKKAAAQGVHLLTASYPM